MMMLPYTPTIEAFPNACLVTLLVVLGKVLECFCIHCLFHFELLHRLREGEQAGGRLHGKQQQGEAKQFNNHGGRYSKIL
jgi:hypothetical protein